MTMTAANGAANERVWARVPPELKAKIEERVETLGLKNEGEWIRSVLAAAVEPESGKDQETAESIDQLARFVQARFDRLEERIFAENSVILQVGFENLMDLAHINAAVLETVFAYEDLTEDEREERLQKLREDGTSHFERRKNELFPALKAMRDDAEKKAQKKALLPDGRDGPS